MSAVRRGSVVPDRAARLRKESTVSRITKLCEWLLKQPFVWGGLCCLAFYAFVVQSAAEGSKIERYFASHPVEYITTALFFVGVAALGIKLVEISTETLALDTALLPRIPKEGEPAARAGSLLVDLDDGPGFLRDSYQVTRLRDALVYVKRKGSADTLETHLRHLQENDSVKMHQGYATVRMISSTIPILGFLGTVIGITLAIAQLDGAKIDESLPAVVSGLSVAFDTTALALSLSIALLFLKFFVERAESRLLIRVDASVESQLIGRFQQRGESNDPNVTAVRRVSEEVLSTVKETGEEQGRLLTGALESTNRRWSDVVDRSTSVISDKLSDGIAEGLALHAKGLNESVAAFATDLEQTMIRHAELLNEGLVHHSDTLTAGAEKHTESITASTDRHSEAVQKGVNDHTDLLRSSLAEHAERLSAAEEGIAEENRRHLSDVEAAVGEALLVSAGRQEKLIQQSEQLLRDMQTSLIESAGTTVAQQEQLVKQGEILLRVIDATNQVQKLEESLNSNLAAVTQSHHFEETLVGLSAVMQLLSARLGQPSGGAGVSLTGGPADQGNRTAADVASAAEQKKAA